MPNIKPVTDLQNYPEVLRDVSFGEPVFLTKEGRGCYVIVDMREYERTNATLRLMDELEKGKWSGEENGWVPSEQVKAYFHERL